MRTEPCYPSETTTHRFRSTGSLPVVKDNPIQFAVVREDPEVERAVLAAHPTDRALLVASGGCTALALQSWFPGMAFTLVDPNPAQLQLVREKVVALEQPLDDEALKQFNVTVDDPRGLSQRGNFESLFRGLRQFVEEFVASPTEIESWFDPATPRTTVAEPFSNPSWKVAFDLSFADSLLNTMFGPAATQHAAPGSYPDYFRHKLENGLTQEEAHSNYFLHHIFLGAYRLDSLPAFMSQPADEHAFEIVEGMIHDAPDIAAHGFVDLSNIMDWMSREECEPVIDSLRREMRPGSTVLFRQLNNDTDRCAWFGDAFEFDDEFGSRLAAMDRSLFYSSIHFGTKT